MTMVTQEYFEELKASMAKKKNRKIKLNDDKTKVILA